MKKCLQNHSVIETPVSPTNHLSSIHYGCGRVVTATFTTATAEVFSDVLYWPAEAPSSYLWYRLSTEHWCLGTSWLKYELQRQRPITTNHNNNNSKTTRSMLLQLVLLLLLLLQSWGPTACLTFSSTDNIRVLSSCGLLVYLVGWIDKDIEKHNPKCYMSNSQPCCQLMMYEQELVFEEYSPL